MMIDKTDVQLVFSKYVMDAYDSYHEAEKRYERGLLTKDGLLAKRDQFEAVRQAFSLAYDELVEE